MRSFCIALRPAIAVGAIVGFITIAAMRDAKAVDAANSEQRCLATTIYHEARGEPREGQVAVAYVIVNRRGKSQFPATICEVVKQGAENGSENCQFSTWCDGRAEQKNAEELDDSLMIAAGVLAGDLSDPTEGSQWFHSVGATPSWAKSFIATVRIGKHQFYRSSEHDTASQ